MNNISVQITGEASPEILSRGTYLLLYHAELIPPHIMIISNGFYYSLSVRGSEIKEPVSKLIRRIHQTKAKVVFIKITGTESVSDPTSYFQTYHAPEEGKITCLFPVRDYLQEFTSIPLSSCRFVFEVFRELEKNEKTAEAYHYYLENTKEENHYFCFNTYSASDIDKCIWMNRLMSSPC